MGVNFLREFYNNLYGKNNSFLILRELIEQLWTNREKYLNRETFDIDIDIDEYKIKGTYKFEYISRGRGSGANILGVNVNGNEYVIKETKCNNEFKTEFTTLYKINNLANKKDISKTPAILG